MTLDPENPIPSPLDLEKSVFAAYGGAVAAISTVERNLHLALVNERIARARQEGNTLADPFGKAERETFNALVKRVAPLCASDSSLAADLAVAVKRRNYLVHDFWYYKVYAALTEDGQKALLTELRRDNAVFEDINERLVKAVVDPGLVALGVDPDFGKVAFMATLKAYEEASE
ncbi:hypothetical protein [Streptomyces sp. NRRL F-5727]|uniref:hypothetical protein n=1 Tax=Streptomyces sp. NRRL F-5727 TaxID=1463871 RepID=UPI0004C8E53B|nr:hypothetical protein [Streptomyces sp. NRRL F-5727]